MGDMLHYLYNGSRVFEWWGLGSATNTTPVVNSGWQPWSKSWVPGAQFIDILIIGAGGGGAAGATKAVGVGGIGGGGGGSGSISRGRFLLATLPDTIYVWLPQGSAGGVPSSGNGTNGGPAFIAIKPCIGATAATDLIMLTSGATGGVAGSAGSGGGAATIPSASLWAYASNALGLAGSNAGAGGGVNSGGSNAIAFSGVTGGGGGAGSTASDLAGGGVVVTSSFVPNVAGGAAGPNDGGNGLWDRDNPFLPWSSTGGGGGGSTNTAGLTGGRGGDGAIGSGGGGGGAGVVAGGAGGRGGDAYMLLIAS